MALGRLQDRVALITGGASGIGRATVELFAQEGASIVLMDRAVANGQAVVAAIEANGGQACFVQGDVTSAADCERAVAEALKRFGRLDILFNNAGIIRRASVLDTAEADWDLVMAVNVKAIFLMSKAAIPHMIAGGGGTIVNTASGWGLTGGRRAAVYCASKGAVVQLTKAMALDHGPDNVRVNCLCPGDTATPMLANEAEQLGQQRDEFMAEAADRPLKRVGRPEDIAQAALYLVSDAAAFVTGTALIVDGGGLAG